MIGEDQTTFRRDIHGLRGLAVILVVLYHAELGVVGGYIGVDVFFVISGFVITSSILRRIDADGTFSPLAFYLRRVRRLVPALLAMLAVVLPLSVLIMSPASEVPQIGRTAISALFFSANAHLFAMSTYENLIDSPLRHLWSLGVEEHFYLALPVLVAYLLRRSRRKTGDFSRSFSRWLVSLFFLSLTASIIFSYERQLGAMGVDIPTPGRLGSVGFHSDWVRRFSFFGSPLRAWEILLGAIVASVPIKCPVRRGWVGVVVLLGLSVSMPMRASFPGLGALLVVSATGLVLGANDPRNKLLSSAPLQMLGTISYAFYLWHWPLLVLGKRLLGDAIEVRIVLVVLSAVAAIVSTRLVESRFLGGVALRRIVAPALLVGVLSVMCSALPLQALISVPKPESKWDNFASEQFGDARCDGSPERWQDICVLPASTLRRDADRIFLFGDSNARAASDGLAAAAQALDQSLTLSVLSGCPFVLTSTADSFGEICQRVNRSRWKELRAESPDVVVVINQSTNYLRSEYAGFGSVREQIEATALMLQELQRLNIPTVFQIQVPNCQGGPSILRPEWICRETQALSGARREFESGLPQQVTMSSVTGPILLNLNADICPSGSCRGFRSDGSVFSDSSHLAPSESRRLAPRYREAINLALRMRRSE